MPMMQTQTQEEALPSARTLPTVERPRLDLPRLRGDLAAVVADIVETKKLLRASGQPGVDAFTWHRLIRGKAKADKLCMLRALSRGRIHRGGMDAATQQAAVAGLVKEYAAPASPAAS